MNDRGKKQIVVHDDYYNLLADAPGTENPQVLAEAARTLLLSKADIISVSAAEPEICHYPTDAGESDVGLRQRLWGKTESGKTAPLSGTDPFHTVVEALREGGCTPLAKLRVNDSHHLARSEMMTEMRSKFWTDHPQWWIGNVEGYAGGEKTKFEGSPCVAPRARFCLADSRPFLLDYAVPEVRRHRLAIVKEFMERYDVDGLTLNFIRDEYCLSFPSRNAPLLTEFVAGCREILDEAAGKRGKSQPILGAIVPWDPNYCRVMGMEVEEWVRRGLLDYISPSPSYVTEFNMPVEPWVRMASSTRCAVYPCITGLSSCHHDVCLPQEYEPQRETQPRLSKVTHENVCALAHGFYAEGADGVSFFNLYSRYYQNLFPLDDIALPERIKRKQRRYIYIKGVPLYRECTFLQLVLAPGLWERKAVKCRLHENLSQADARVRFKARHLACLEALCVDVNGREIPPDRLSLVPHDGEGFLYVEFQLEDGMLREGDNEIGFAFRENSDCVFTCTVTIIQEVEIRVVPR